MKPISLRTLVSTIVVFVAAVTALSIPAGYLFVEYSAARNNLAFKAHLKANRLAKYIYSNTGLWQYQNVRLAELIEVPEAQAQGDQQRIFDVAGKLVIETGPTPVYPTMAQAAPIVVDGATVGRIEVATSARSLAINTGVAAALSCLLGLGMFFAVRLFPLRVLTRTLEALESSQHTLRVQNARFEAALNNMSQGLIMFDPDEQLVVCNDQYIEMYDLSRDVVKSGCSLRELLHHRSERGRLHRDPDQYRAELLAKLSLGEKFNFVVEAGDGHEISVKNQPMLNGGWVAIHEDITERRKAEARIFHMAHHDALTGLANRTHLIEQLNGMLTVLPLRGGSLAVHFMDIDRFKEVNDTLGHDGGDLLLKVVAERLRSVIRVGDVAARLGGDEFLVVQADVKNEDQAENFARRLRSALIAPTEVEEQEIVATVSVGIALAPADGISAERLLKCADLALYKAKNDGRNCIRLFRPEMDGELQARIRLEKTIRNAVVVKNGFVLHYQPVYEISGRHLIGFEALVRMPAEDGTLIPPLVFIPVAEDLRLIDKIGAWVLQEACRTAALWPKHLTIAVNLSPAQFAGGSINATVAAALQQSGLDPHRLELEITETLLLGDSVSVMEQLRALKILGVAVVMDDFGIGYSSLSYLWRFPFDKIKIDRSFMQGFDGSGRDAATVVKAIIGLGRELRMRVTVEGVETAKQAAFLEHVDGDQAQGFFFGRPVPASEVGAHILADFQKRQTPTLGAVAS